MNAFRKLLMLGIVIFCLLVAAGCLLLPTPTYTITATAGNNGSIDPAGEIDVKKGADQAFTITPDTGYEIEDVLVDGVSVGAVTSYTFENVTENHTITATFTEVTHTITATAGEGGSVSPSGDVTVGHGKNRTFTITPNTGFKIEDVEVDGVSVGAVPTYTFVNVTKDHEITATFSEIVTYTITATSGANGKILPSGSVPVNEGDDQRFFMDPNPGYAVYDVLVDKDSVGAVEEYTFENIAQDHEIHVTFIKTYTITASAGAGGSISPSGNVTVNDGADQAFTITPDTGYEIDDVTVDGSSVGAVVEYTFNNVTENHTIEAVFTD